MLTPHNQFLSNLLIPVNSAANEAPLNGTASNSMDNFGQFQQGQILLNNMLLSLLLANNAQRAFGSEDSAGVDDALDEGHQLMEALKEKEQRKCKDMLEEMAQYFLLHQNAAQSRFGPLELNIPEQLAQNCAASSSSASSPSELGSSICGSPFGLNFEAKTTEEAKIPQMPMADLKEEIVDQQQRPHRCDQCQKSFRFKSNLFEHKSLHLATGHRNPFVCPFCAKTCRLKGNLKKHLQVHVTSVEDLERLWKRSFSRQSGRPRKNAPPAPLPKPGDDLGLVPVLLMGGGDRRPNSSASSSSSSTSSLRYSPIGASHPPIQWTFAD